MEFENIPPIDPRLIEALRKSEIFSMKGLLCEGNLEGVEQLGFIKGVEHTLQVLENIQLSQKEDLEEKEFRL